MESLDGRLVIGVSSRALFDLETENEIFEKYGVAKYRKYQEEHLQRAYTLDVIKELVESSGLVFVKAYDAYTLNEPNEYSERICVVAKECGKSYT
jgi:hypothetical protein